MTQQAPKAQKIPHKIRKFFGTVSDVAHIPDLIEIQRHSYEQCLQMHKASNERDNIGLESVFRSIFPIDDGNATLQYEGYEFEQPKYTVEECANRGTSYAAPLRFKLRLIVWDTDITTKSRQVRNIKEQEVYMSEIPLMTERGTFMINGSERVIVSQMHRAPGAFYFDDEGKKHSSGKRLHSARIISYRGSWLDIESDAKDLIYFRVDRKRKLYITTLLRALGYDRHGILDLFYNKVELKKEGRNWIVRFDVERFKNTKVSFDVIDAKTNEIIIPADTKVSPRIVKKLEEYQDERFYVLRKEEIIGSFAGQRIETEEGSIICDSGDVISEEVWAEIENNGFTSFKILDIDFIKVGPYIRNTLILDKNITREDAIIDIYRVLRPGEPSTLEAAENVFKALFFDKDRYDLSVIGRMKINMKHNLNIPADCTILTNEDIVAVIKHLLEIKIGTGTVDDIDNLGNRRVRSVGELFENQIRLGLVRMSRAILERMSVVEIDTVMPYELVNSKIVMALVKEFFGRSQLSQYTDQTNALAWLTHLRRLSAYGPGGVSSDAKGAAYEMRDVHPTHYGRLCPIETPEGPNIGLINSLACYAAIDSYGFIQTPYKRLVNQKVTEEVVYLSATEESRYIIAQANSKVDESGQLLGDIVTCRKNEDIITAHPSEVEFIDVSPKQLVSVAASLIPFLEHDDANRALMGSNMQRQAVPLIKSQAPLVGTGMEKVVARSSGAAVLAKRSGIVDQVDSHRIVIRTDGSEDGTPGVDIYTLVKFQKSNHGTCINQRPIVKAGDWVDKGDVIADGSSVDNGELALGKNILVAFMPWMGYNFEDSIVISSRMIENDTLTSIHINEFVTYAMDTRNGPEEITADIPNANEYQLRKLDESGVIYVGAEVRPGDVLVGKVTPKSEAPITPEEKLLRAIFGEKARDVKDSSLRVPPGVTGTVIHVCSFTRRGIEKDERTISKEREEIQQLTQNRDDKLEIIQSRTYELLIELLDGKFYISGVKGLKSQTNLTREILAEIPRRQLWSIIIDEANTMDRIHSMKEAYDKWINEIESEFRSSVEKVQSGDDLPQGALRVVKVYVATKMVLQPGDKLAGRHGNKGVVSRIVPIEDMPFLEDGTPVDMVLNPLGVPSRMNIGQILETHLGWASFNLGRKIELELSKARAQANYDSLRNTLLDIYTNQKDPETMRMIEYMDQTKLDQLAQNLTFGVPVAVPVFESANEDQINEMLIKAGVSTSGQVKLIDGRTGVPFERDVTVGYAYMMKLNHLVTEKMHARATGPYSLVTQQPLGGKSHFGGQRFGEMECWALQAYGAAYILWEMLTVKSDDVDGRLKMYEAIVQGNSAFSYGVPESFNVIIKELNSLCLNIEIQDAESNGTK